MKASDIRFNFKTLIVVISFYSIVLLLTNALWGATETSEARYAEISREMFVSKDLVHPSLLNIQHYHKPPITYWLTSTAFALFGVNDFSVRFFLVVAYFIQTVLVFKIARTLFNEEPKAFWSAFIYCNLPIVLISIRALTTDAFNNTFVLLTIWSCINFKQHDNLKWLYVTAIFAGLAFLSKGPIVLLITAPVYLFVKVGTIQKPHINKIHYLFALFVFMIVGGSWYLYLVSQDRTFFDYFVMRHFVDRFMHAEVFTRREPWYYYLWVFPLVSIPWVVVFISRIKKTNALTRSILLGWFIIPLIIFSAASSKLVLYILPLFAGYAIVTSDVLTNGKFPKRLFTIVYLVILTSLDVIPIASKEIAISNYWLAIPVVGVIAIAIIYYTLRDDKIIVFLSSAVFTMTLLIFSALLFHSNALKFNSSLPLADYIIENDMREKTIIVFDELLPSLAFELNKEIVSIYNGNKSLERETQFEKNIVWKGFYYDLHDRNEKDRLRVLLHQPTVLVMKEKKKDDLPWLIQSYKHHVKIQNWLISYN